MVEYVPSQLPANTGTKYSGLLTNCRMLVAISNVIATEHVAALPASLSPVYRTKSAYRLPAAKLAAKRVRAMYGFMSLAFHVKQVQCLASKFMRAVG